MRFTRLTETAKVPTRGSKGAAGYDLYADWVEETDDICVIVDDKERIVPAGRRIKVHTGVAIALPEGFVGLIFPRSGLSIKQGLRLQNTVGVIDDDYRGEIIVAMEASPTRDAAFSIGDRIAQLVIMPYAVVNWEEVDKLEDTERGTGGFGSTGK